MTVWPQATSGAWNSGGCAHLIGDEVETRKDRESVLTTYDGRVCGSRQPNLLPTIIDKE